MKYSLAWIGRYVDLSGVDVDELADRFTLSVAELEGIERFGAGLEPVVVARILERRPHPNADRLSLCTVDAGGAEPVEVVCGAPNAAAGLVTAYAPLGTRIGEITLERRKIRGVYSNGMLCSERELGLGEDHDGIADLGAVANAGTPLTAIAPLIDAVLEVDNKSITHRPDLWGHYGVAREIAGLLGRPLRAPEEATSLGDGGPPAIEIADLGRCPRYCAVGLGGVQVGPSPLWMQALLQRCGVRAINNVVDATNFVMMELGNPLHAFDARQIKGGRITVRLADDGERVVTLDDKERALTAEDLLICDGERPVAVAGVMGLQNSEVADDTTDVVLEAAAFSAESVRRTSLRLGLRTEASARFEKSLDPTLPETAARRFAAVLTEICPGATITTRLGSEGAPPPPPVRITTSVAYINDRLGHELAPERIHESLRSVGFSVDDVDGDRFDVGVPSFRANKDVGIPEDLVEEIGRLYGYDNIPPAHPVAHIPRPWRHPLRTLLRRAQTWLGLHLGYHEAPGYSFDAEPLLARIGGAPGPRIRVRNAISAEQTHLRGSLLPNLFAAVERSAAQRRPLALFEVGRVFEPAASAAPAHADDLPPQPWHLGLAVWRPAAEALDALGEGADDAAAQRAAFFELKADVEALCARLGLAVRFLPAAPEPAATRAGSWLHPVRRARLQAATGEALGLLGAVHPDACDGLELGPFFAAAELDLEAMLAVAPADPPRYQPFSRFPPVPFDLSIIVPEAVTCDQLLERIVAAHPAWVQRADFVGLYRGEPIPEGQKSMTFHIRFGAADRTLEMDEVNAVVERLVARLGDELGGWLRL